MLLKQPECVARVVELHYVHAKGIPEAMRANTSYPAGLGIHQGRETSPPGTVPYDLPRSVPVKTEEKHRAVTKDCSIAVNMVSQHFKGIPINRQSPDTPVFLLMFPGLVDFLTALRAELVSLT